MSRAVLRTVEQRGGRAAEVVWLHETISCDPGLELAMAAGGALLGLDLVLQTERLSVHNPPAIAAHRERIAHVLLGLKLVLQFHGPVTMCIRNRDTPFRIKVVLHMSHVTCVMLHMSCDIEACKGLHCLGCPAWADVQ